MSKYTKGFCALKKTLHTNVTQGTFWEIYACLQKAGISLLQLVITASYPFITEKGMIFGHLKSSKYFNKFFIKIKNFIWENLKKRWNSRKALEQPPLHMLGQIFISKIHSRTELGTRVKDTSWDFAASPKWLFRSAD